MIWQGMSNEFPIKGRAGLGGALGKLGLAHWGKVGAAVCHYSPLPHGFAGVKN